MNVNRYEPRYRPLALLDRLLAEDDVGGPLFGREPDSVTDWLPAVDIQEEPEHYLLRADLPGVDPDKIDVTMENGVLTIRGNRDTEKRENRGGFQRYERVRGSFLRRFTLPDTANGEDIKAQTRNGVLEVTIPKHPKVQPRRIDVRQA